MNVPRSCLELLGIVGAGRSGLLAGRAKVTDREHLLIAELMVEFDNAIEAVVVRCAVREVVVRDRSATLGVGREEQTVQVAAKLIDVCPLRTGTGVVDT